MHSLVVVELASALASCFQVTDQCRTSRWYERPSCWAPLFRSAPFTHLLTHLRQTHCRSILLRESTMMLRTGSTVTIASPGRPAGCQFSHSVAQASANRPIPRGFFGAGGQASMSTAGILCSLDLGVSQPNSPASSCAGSFSLKRLMSNDKLLLDIDTLFEVVREPPRTFELLVAVRTGRCLGSWHSQVSRET